MLLLLRDHSDAFRHRKCLIPLAPHCDYSWHGTTPGPRRSWAESMRTPTPVSRARSSPVPGVVPMGNNQSRREQHPTWPIIVGACRLQTFRRASRSSRVRITEGRVDCLRTMLSYLTCLLYLIRLNLLKD